MKSTAEAVLFVCRNEGIYSAFGRRKAEYACAFGALTSVT